MSFGEKSKVVFPLSFVPGASTEPHQPQPSVGAILHYPDAGNCFPSKRQPVSAQNLWCYYDRRGHRRV